MKSNPLLDLESLGQSIWIDFIRREMISSGEMRRLIQEDGVSGVTSNPSIFEKAIAESPDYDDAIRALTLEGKTPDEIISISRWKISRWLPTSCIPFIRRQMGGMGS